MATSRSIIGSGGDELDPVPAPSTTRPRAGPITLFMGSMYSGKTARLISRMERYNLMKKRCVVIGWKDDNRYTDEAKIVSHNNSSWPCRKMDDETLLKSVDQLAESYDVVGIDEGCFFKSIVEACLALSEAGVIVYVSSLVGDFNRKPFGNICNLIPVCAKVEQTFAICSGCSQENACFTHLTKSSLKSIPVGSAGLIGGTEKYQSLCPGCFSEAYDA
jgi:thymidine kinase